MDKSKLSTAAIVALAVAVPAIIFVAWRVMKPAPDASIVQAASELPQAIADIEALGLTLDPDEFGRRLQVPAADNAAPIIQAIAYDVRGPNGFDSLFGWSSMLEDSESVVLCVEYDNQNPDVLDRLRLVASKSGCDFQRDWSEGAEMLVPEFASIKAMVKYCAYLAEADAESNRYDSALEKLLIADSIARFADFEPTMIGRLVAIAGKAIIGDAVIRILISDPGNPEVQDLLRGYASQAKPLGYIATCLAGQALMAATSVSQIVANGELLSDDPDFLEAISTVDRRVFADASLAVYLQAYAPMYNSMSSDRPFSEIANEIRQLQDSVENDTSPSMRFMHFMLPVMPNFVRMHGRAVVMDKMLSLTSDVLHRSKEIGLEAAVAELDGTVYDPITGGSFHVVVADPGFKVYTIGYDGIDEGGPTDVGKEIFYRETIDDMGYLIPYGSD